MTTGKAVKAAHTGRRPGPGVTAPGTDHCSLGLQPHRDHPLPPPNKGTGGESNSWPRDSKPLRGTSVCCGNLHGMATWRVIWALSSGRQFTRDIEATAKHTQDGLVSFVRWPVRHGTAGPVIIWQRPEDRITSVEQIDNPPRPGRRADESAREWLERAQHRQREINAALNELEDGAGLGRPVGAGQPFPLVTDEIVELGELQYDVDAEVLAAHEAIARERS